MTKIKFGTDGWRAIIAKDFTVDNVARVTLGSVEWLKQNFDNPSVVVGHDCRYAGELFAETTAKVFANAGIKVLLAKGPVSTPMVSLGTLNKKAALGIVITASHNPPTYNGYKLKGHFGGPLLPKEIQEVEDLIPDTNSVDLDGLEMETFYANGLIENVDLETMYVDHVEASFDMDAIRNSDMNFAYDAMYGSGQDVMRRLLPDIDFLHCEHNPGFNGTAPEPIHRNLVEFSEMIKMAEGVPVIIQSGIENDFKVTADQIEAAITDKTKLMIFSTPCNPTGSVYSKNELESIAKMMEKHPNFYVICDEIYEHINYGVTSHASMAEFEDMYDRTITVNGVAKAFAMTGWRIGYIGAPNSIARACNKMQGQVTSGANCIAQRAVITALEAPVSKIVLPLMLLIMWVTVPLRYRAIEHCCKSE